MFSPILKRNRRRRQRPLSVQVLESRQLFSADAFAATENPDTVAPEIASFIEVMPVDDHGLYHTQDDGSIVHSKHPSLTLPGEFASFAQRSVGKIDLTESLEIRFRPGAGEEGTLFVKQNGRGVIEHLDGTTSNVTDIEIVPDPNLIGCLSNQVCISTDMHVFPPAGMERLGDFIVIARDGRALGWIVHGIETDTNVTGQPSSKHDVDGDGMTTSSDAFLLMRLLESSSEERTSSNLLADYDVNEDGRFSANDVLHVINRIGTHAAGDSSGDEDAPLQSDTDRVERGFGSDDNRDAVFRELAIAESDVSDHRLL